MGAGRKIYPTKVVTGGPDGTLPQFTRRSNLLGNQGTPVENLADSMLAKVTDINIFQHDLQHSVVIANQKM